MRRAWLGLAIALGLAAPSLEALASEPAKPRESADVAAREDAQAAAWDARLSEAQARLAAARERVAQRERALGRARHRRYPRGEELDDLVDALAAARKELASAEAELPELVEQARREGVAPGVLRRFEPEE